jgi:hypothetical protein
LPQHRCSGKHGVTSDLTVDETAELIAYLERLKTYRAACCGWVCNIVQDWQQRAT